MDDAEIDMYTRVYAREFRYKYRFPLRDKEGNEIKQEQETEDKDRQDYRLVRITIDDMFNQYSYQYQDNKDKMISNMSQIAKQMGDTNVRSLIAHCVIFPRILNEFREILLKELESRKK